MLTNLFILFLNMSINASIVAIVLFLWRGLTRRYIPYKFYYILWGTVFFRLLFPYSFRSIFSIFNFFELTNSSFEGQYIVSIEYIQSTGVSQIIANNPNNYTFLLLLSLCWLVAALALISWWVFLYVSANKKLEYAILCKDSPALQCAINKINFKGRVSLYTSTNVDSPFTIGFFKPKIILPQTHSNNEKELECVLIHELVHIKRRDPLIKAAMFFTCALHWYNPVIWFCFKLFNEDIEHSCDQKVLVTTSKKDYAIALVNYASEKSSFAAGYLSFAKNKVFARVNTVLGYKKLPVYKIVIFTVITLMLGFSISTNPVLSSEYTYIPQTVLVDNDTRVDIENLAMDFAKDLQDKNITNIAEKSTQDPEFFSQMYTPFSKGEINLVYDKAFFTSVNSADVYFDTVTINNELFSSDNQKLVATVKYNNYTKSYYIETLHSYNKYSHINTVDYDNEAVQLVQNMVKFNVTDGAYTEDNIEKLAAFCIDIAYRRTGQKDIYIEPDLIKQIAYEFFLIENFDYTQNRLYFDKGKQCYIYDKSRETFYEHQIIDLTINDNSAVITVEFYLDPLQTQIEKTIQYTLDKI